MIQPTESHSLHRFPQQFLDSLDRSGVAMKGSDFSGKPSTPYHTSQGNRLDTDAYSNDMHEKLSDASMKSKKKTDPYQRTLIYAYTTNHHVHINRALIGGTGGEEHAAAFRVAVVPNEHDFTTFHGISRLSENPFVSVLSGAARGDRIKLNGITSSSVSHATARGFADVKMMGPEAINSPKETHMIIFHHAKGRHTGVYLAADYSAMTDNPYEREFAIPHGATGTYIGHHSVSNVVTNYLGDRVHHTTHFHHIELDNLDDK